MRIPRGVSPFVHATTDPAARRLERGAATGRPRNVSPASRWRERWIEATPSAVRELCRWNALHGRRSRRVAPQRIAGDRERSVQDVRRAASAALAECVRRRRAGAAHTIRARRPGRYPHTRRIRSSPGARLLDTAPTSGTGARTAAPRRRCREGMPRCRAGSRTRCRPLADSLDRPGRGTATRDLCPHETQTAAPAASARAARLLGSVAWRAPRPALGQELGHERERTWFSTRPSLASARQPPAHARCAAAQGQARS